MKKVIGIISFFVIGWGSSLGAQACNGIALKSNFLPPEQRRLSPCGLRTVFLPRSQGANKVLQDAGWREYLSGCDGRVWGNFSIAINYNHSLKSERIAQYFFGSTQLSFSGSQVLSRKSTDLLADNFGLPTSFQGALSFKPTIDSILMNVNYEIGLDSWYPGLYARFNFPIVTTRWDLGVHCHEMNNLTGQEALTFPPCYMSEAPTVPALSIREALSGNLIFGDMQQPLTFGKFACGRVKRTGLADVCGIFGLRFCESESAETRGYLQVVAPAGNLPRGEFLFQPLFGNGHFWELGVGLAGHCDIYREEYHVFSLYYNAALTTQFSHFQVRSFDLVGRGPLSRYLLLKEFDSQGRYDRSLVNAIDFSTRETRVGGPVVFDGYVKAVYYYDRTGFELGYNCYARSQEKLRIQDDLFPADLTNRSFGIKGTEGVCFRFFNTVTGAFTGQPGLLNSTQHRATSFSDAPTDNPCSIPVAEGIVPLAWNSTTTPDGRVIAVQSCPPLILDIDALDLTSGASPSQLTHKFFAHVSYTALNRVWEPQIGCGAMIEIDGRSKFLSALNQWGFWIKGTVSF